MALYDINPIEVPVDDTTDLWFPTTIAGGTIDFDLVDGITRTWGTFRVINTDGRICDIVLSTSQLDIIAMLCFNIANDIANRKGQAGE